MRQYQVVTAHLVLVISILTGCSSPKSTTNLGNPTPSIDSATLAKYQISEITYELDVNWGINEIDKIVMRKDGAAEYLAGHGAAFRNDLNPHPQFKGSYRGNFDPAEFQNLATIIIQSDFFSRNDRYSSLVADASTITTTVVYAGGRKTAVNYGGGGDHDVGNVQQAIIGLAKKVPWRKY